VAPDASVESAIVGAGCRIHPVAQVLESVLLPGAEVGPGARVLRSILGRDCRIGDGARVLNLSVIGDGYQVEPGAHLDGARLPAAEPV
ncbi:MAG: NDP-sugar synthase, partial [Actinomycetota bacterium]|nr:NDP-sugar synthase [Actinomycetota bacterium]